LKVGHAGGILALFHEIIILFQVQWLEVGGDIAHRLRRDTEPSLQRRAEVVLHGAKVGQVSSSSPIVIRVAAIF
jgi:hypothetical protein